MAPAPPSRARPRAPTQPPNPMATFPSRQTLCSASASRGHQRHALHPRLNSRPAPVIRSTAGSAPVVRTRTGDRQRTMIAATAWCATPPSLLLLAPQQSKPPQVPPKSACHGLHPACSTGDAAMMRGRSPCPRPISLRVSMRSLMSSAILPRSSQTLHAACIALQRPRRP